MLKSNWWPRVRLVLLVLLAAAGCFAPWCEARVGGSWIAAAEWAAAHRLASDLAAATQLVTGAAAALAVLGAALRLAARRIGASGWISAWVQSAGLLAVCVPIAVLMPVRGAMLYLAGCVVVAAYDLVRGRVAAKPAAGRLQAVLRELFPVFSAAIFVGFGWQYNAQLLIRLLLVAGGLALIAQAFVLPASREPAPGNSAGAGPSTRSEPPKSS